MNEFVLLGTKEEPLVVAVGSVTIIGCTVTDILLP